MTHPLHFLSDPSQFLRLFTFTATAKPPDSPENHEDFPLRPGHRVGFPHFASTLLEISIKAKLFKYFKDDGFNFKRTEKQDN